MRKGAISFASISDSTGLFSQAVSSAQLAGLRTSTVYNASAQRSLNSILHWPHAAAMNHSMPYFTIGLGFCKTIKKQFEYDQKRNVRIHNVSRRGRDSAGTDFV